MHGSLDENVQIIGGGGGGGGLKIIGLGVGRVHFNGYYRILF